MLSPSPFKKVKNCHVTLTSVPVNVESWQTLPYNVLNKSFGKQVEIQILVYLFVYFKTQRDFCSAFFLLHWTFTLKLSFPHAVKWKSHVGTLIEDLLFGMHRTKNTAIYQILFQLVCGTCFAFQIHSLNTCLWVSAYYLITVMAYNKSVHPCGIIYNKIKVELLDSGCLTMKVYTGRIKKN